MADWLDITTGVGGLLGNLGSSIGGLFQASANRKFQAKQAELQRQFNAAEAQKARDYNTQMINAQNQYNSPQEQVKRLVAAGLHPALAYGGSGAIQNIGVGSTSAQASSGASPSGAMADLSSLGHLGTDVSSTLDSLAAARQKSIEAGMSAIALKYADDFQRGNLRLLSYNVNIAKENVDVTRNTALKLGQELTNLKETFNLIKAQIKTEGTKQDLNTQQANSASSQAGYFDELSKFIHKETNWVDLLSSAEVRERLSSANLSSAQAKQILDITPLMCTVLSEEANNLHFDSIKKYLEGDEVLSRIIHYNAETNKIEFDIRNTWDLKVFEAIVTLTSSALNAYGHSKK